MQISHQPLILKSDDGKYSLILQITFTEGESTVSFLEYGESPVKVGLDNVSFVNNFMFKDPVFARGQWIDDHTFSLLVDGPGVTVPRTYTLTFNDQTVKLSLRYTGLDLVETYSGTVDLETTP
ncbi:MAG TPA: hypothetical protein VHL11_08590 [Phototrophicaceae bacterium]|jgi:hypothetical protein|nr:hypothetical protein [Phototrophicaceae bacterium]